MTNRLTSILIHALAVTMGAGLTGATAVLAGQATPSVRIRMFPDAVIDDAPRQGVVQVQASEARYPSLALRLIAPPGIALKVRGVSHKPNDDRGQSEQVIDLERVDGASAVMFEVKGESERPLGESVLLAGLEAKDSVGTTRLVALEQATLRLVAPRLPIRSFLLAGILGIGCGYLVRLLLEVFRSLPRPLPQPPAAEVAAGALTKFVSRHYYRTEFALTLLLGIFALLALTSHGVPPANIESVGGAGGLGFSLGLLTNTEIILRFKR